MRVHQDWDKPPSLCRDCREKLGSEWHILYCQECGAEMRAHRDWDPQPKLCSACKSGKGTAVAAAVPGSQSVRQASGRDHSVEEFLSRDGVHNEHNRQGGAAARRFAIALSFPGEARARIGAIADHLARHLGRDRILYDRFHEAEFARPNLDLYLQQMYHDQAELNVVFLCNDYERKEWCGLEWRAIRDLIKHRREEIMLFRLDDAPVSGVFSIDGYINMEARSADEVTALILQRRTQHLRIQSSQEPTRQRPAPREWRPRARQNVVFELGFFVGKLGRKRVCALMKEGVETPSDFSGVIYIRMDENAAWQAALAKEMKAAGLKVDLLNLA